MESAPSTCFLGRRLAGGGHKCRLVTFNPSYFNRSPPPSCKMRQRNLSWQNKKHAKKFNLERRQMNTSFQEKNVEDDSDPNNLAKDRINGSNQDTVSKDSVPVIIEAEYSTSTRSKDESSPSNEENTSSASPSHDIALPSTNVIGGEQLQGVQLHGLISMLRNAEKNIHLLNHARVRALEELDQILSEKEALQGEINILEMKLAETDARLKVAAQEKVHVELLQDQLVKLRKDPSGGSVTMAPVQETSIIDSSSQTDTINSFSQELYLLREENMTLKNELQALKSELSNIKETDQRVQVLEEERSSMESSLKELEHKVVASHEGVSNISSLKSEYKSLYEKVGDLQNLLDTASTQADQAIIVLKQNQELRKKVDKIEESLSDANAYRLSSEKLQQYNELMQQKMKLLDERLQNSDNEINSYVQSYQYSMQEFQETLNNLKQESLKREEDKAVDHRPWEFWSKLLLMVDGWSLEKKISVDEADLLREMIRNREESICNAYMSSKEKNEREIIATFLNLISPEAGEKLNVVHIAAEMAPVAKVGGLGDVVTGLGKALQKRGHLVEIILPKYDCMNYELIQDFKALDVPVESYFDGQLFKNKIWLGTVEGLPVYFIEPCHPGKFFWRGQFYGEPDDFKRFSFFSRAALELLLQAGKKPDIIHCHDWQTAFIAPLYWDIFAPKGLNSARVCFTCHNFEYQGLAPAAELSSCGLDPHHLNRPDRMQDNSASDRINPVKGAIVFSNIVTTVSPSYSKEMRTPEEGRGLHATLNTHSKKFLGVLNGIDTDAWNPATDPFLKVQYNANDIEAKAENKQALRRRLGMSSSSPEQPLVACITRLVPQKGVHLIRHALYRTLELGGQFVLLGSSPVAQIQREFEDIANHFKTHEDARLILKYDESLSHSIYAASDMFIIPSIFEPCGLTQMIAMRYGSIPIARKTGGLNDSVFDIDDTSVPAQYRNGFTFVTADEQGFNYAFERAFNHYKKDGEGWKKLIRKVMSMDFGWETSASIYEELYLDAAARARSTNRT